MVTTRLPSLLCVGGISCLVGLVSVGCRQASEATSEPSVSESAIPAAESASEAAEEPVPAEEPVSERDTEPSAAEDEAIATTPAPPASTDAAKSPEPPVAEAPTAASELQCAAAAYVADTDPAGLNVRSGPGRDFAAIDTLPTDGPVEVTIIGAAHSWLKLEVAWSLEQQELEEPGWVYAPLLGVTTQNSDTTNPEALVPLFSDPDVTADVAAEVPKFAEVVLLSCSGDWLQVQLGETTGWLATDNQCSSPVTTCP